MDEDSVNVLKSFQTDQIKLDTLSDMRNNVKNLAKHIFVVKVQPSYDLMIMKPVDGCLIYDKNKNFNAKAFPYNTVGGLPQLNKLLSFALNDSSKIINKSNGMAKIFLDAEFHNEILRIYIDHGRKYDW